MLFQGVMNMLEAIRATGLTHSIKFYQASTSELYGKVQHSKSNINKRCKRAMLQDPSYCKLQCMHAPVSD